jgi:hypothetical protein
MNQKLHTYDLYCKQCGSTERLELSKELSYEPKCFKCGMYMLLKFYIGPDGELDIFDRDSEIKAFIKEILEQDHELLERLGSDYDEHGVPYWEK